MNQFILALFSMTDKLKTSTLFHLLTGKRTSAIMSYAYFVDLLPFLGSQPELSQAVFNKSIAQLEKERLINQLSNGLYAISSEGRKKSDTFKTSRLKQVDYFNFGRSDIQCFRLLAYFVQQVVQTSEKPLRPLETSPLYTRPVMQLCKENQVSKASLSKELTSLFQALPQSDGDFLAQQLSGNDVLPQTNYQLLPAKFQSPPWDSIYFASCLHPLLNEIKKSDSKTYCYQLLKGLLRQNYNSSMLLTRKQLLSGQSILQVAANRHLKVGTVSDHIIEWALFDRDFSFAAFISPKTYTYLESLPITDIFTVSYRDIYNQFPLEFFEFRLYQIQKKREAFHGVRR